MKFKTNVTIVLLIALFIGVGFSMAFRHQQRTSEPFTTDDNLRAFLGIRSIRANYKPAVGHHFFVLRTLRFENGNLIGQGSETRGSISEHGLTVEFLWGMVDSKFRTTLNIDGDRIHSEDDYWSKLNFAHKSAGDRVSVGKHGSYDILGFAQSADAVDPKNKSIGFMTFDETLKNKKYVGALAIRSYVSKEEAALDD